MGSKDNQNIFYSWGRKILPIFNKTENSKFFISFLSYFINQSDFEKLLKIFNWKQV